MAKKETIKHDIDALFKSKKSISKTAPKSEPAKTDKSKTEKPVAKPAVKKLSAKAKQAKADKIFEAI